MGLLNMVDRWSETHTVYIASLKDKYNQCTYTETTILGRLVQIEEEITTYNNNLQDRNMGDKVISRGKLYSTSSILTIDSKVGAYRVMSKKACKDKNNAIQFYKYLLK